MPAHVAVKSNFFISRYGMYASAAKKAPATIPRISTTLGSPAPARSVRRGNSGITANPIASTAPSATGHLIEGCRSAEKPTTTAKTATTTASTSRTISVLRSCGVPRPRSTPRRRTAIIRNAAAVSTATPRNAQRQSRYSATAPARKGPTIDGTTHAAAKAAKIRPCRWGGYSRATTTYSATVCPPVPRPWTSRPIRN